MDLKLTIREINVSCFDFNQNKVDVSIENVEFQLNDINATEIFNSLMKLQNTLLSTVSVDKF
ncbi:MAG: hypothetical protein N2043_01530 [Ignavibacterium sp.]|nr:hypothetical protein [Ignavibacterium sp.]